MTSHSAVRPAPSEHHPYYASYVALTPDGDLVHTLHAQLQVIDRLFRAMSEVTASSAYAPGKWTVREALGHLIDTERVMCYRAIAFSRGDAQPLPSFDQAAWLPHAEYESRLVVDVLDEWIAVRRATAAFARALPAAAWSRIGIASERPFSVRALLWIIPGHVNYHLKELGERYGVVIPA